MPPIRPISCWSFRRLPVLALLLAVAAHAQQPTLTPVDPQVLQQQTPPGGVLLAHGGPPCGAGDLYFVQSGRYSAQELGWARQSFALIYFYEQGMSNAAILEYGTGHRVSRARADALMRSPDYLAWAGERGRAALEKLREARRVYLAQARKSDATLNNQGQEAFDKLPEVAAFRAARRAARAWLVERMGLQVKPDLARC
ncbi:MAG: hypothetical protein JWN73_5191 [Betaproteobacteria bacterium]|nr:hypothetical protein [Betaproteobacteria bacterium]